MRESTGRHLPPPEFGPALAAVRAAAGLSLGQAAARCGISRGYWWLLETGQRCPSQSVARALAAGLDVDDAARAVIEGAGLPGRGRDNAMRQPAGTWRTQNNRNGPSGLSSTGWGRRGGRGGYAAASTGESSRDDSVAAATA